VTFKSGDLQTGQPRLAISIDAVCLGGIETASASYHQRLFAIRAILFMLFSFFFEVEFLATVTTFKLLASLFHFDTSLVEYCGRSRQHPTFNTT
jgi:hypothetical protein